MITINVDNLKFLVKSNISILEACKYIGINIPKFCYHESLSVAGNCRMCLVELQKTPKPVAACAMPVSNNISVFTLTPLVKKARENVLETLLINHPLDCPICDQGGECDLQDETKNFGVDLNRYFFSKRSVEEKNCGLIIKTIMTRCIHCTRCVRFSSEIAGNNFFGTINRGVNTEISNYVSKSFNSFISGNVIDLCPVGALTSKNYAFKARPWELKSVASIDLTDGSGTAIYFNYKESEIVRIIPKINKEINENWISDRVRFSFDAFNNSRLHSIFEQQSKNTFIQTNWNFIFKKLKCSITQDLKKITFLINSEVDLQSLIFIKKIVTRSKNQLKVVTTENKRKNNLYISGLINKISDIKNSNLCFLIYVNIHLENIVINTKLKVKYNKQNYTLFNFGSTFNSVTPVNFSNLSLKMLLSFFESKIKNLSQLFIKTSSPLILLGERFLNKIANKNCLIAFLKQKIANIIIIDVRTKSNSEGLNFLNIFSNSSVIYKKADFFVSFNLMDNYQARKYFDIKKENYWINSYGSILAAKNKYILPSLNYIEENNAFLNLEQRPQQTSILFTKINNAKSPKFFLKYILRYIFMQKIAYEYNHYAFVKEMLKDLSLFKKIKTKLSFSLSKILFNYEISKTFFSTYVIKSIFEDFFLINNFCKNSLTMNKFSIEYRKINKNFYF